MFRPARIYLDLDGVMADFDAHFPATFGLDHRSMADDAMWQTINGHPSYFRDMPPCEGAVAFFRSIERLNPIILTACPKTNYPHVARQKREWVREHLSKHVTVLPVLGGRHKPLFMQEPGDILIDDWEKNIAAWREAGGEGILHRDFEATAGLLANYFAPPPAQDPVPALGVPAGEVEGLRALDESVDEAIRTLEEVEGRLGIGTDDVEIDTEKYHVREAKLAFSKAATSFVRSHVLAPPASAADGEGHHGWLFHNPDTGTEWSADHPIESGEVEDATDVRAATLLELHGELIEAWKSLGEQEDAFAKRIAALTTQPPVPPSRVAGLDREAVRDALVAYVQHTETTNGLYRDGGFDAIDWRRRDEVIDAILDIAPTPGETPGQDAVEALADCVPWTAWPIEDADSEPSDPSVGHCTEWYIGIWRAKDPEPLFKILVGVGRNGEVVARRIAERLRSEVNTIELRTALASLRSTQADTGGESQTPAPAGDAVEALKVHFDFLNGLTENGAPSQRKVLNPIILGMGAASCAEAFRAALAAIAQEPGAGQAGLDLAALHAANIKRQAEWCPDQVPDLSFRGNELAGETGEACNVIKKLERERHGWRGSRATLSDLAEELADVVICADLCAVTAGIDLSAAVTAKFNATSDKVGISVRLPAAPATAASEGDAA